MQGSPKIEKKPKRGRPTIGKDRKDRKLSRHLPKACQEPGCCAKFRDTWRLERHIERRQGGHRLRDPDGHGRPRGRPLVALAVPAREGDYVPGDGPRPPPPPPAPPPHLLHSPPLPASLCDLRRGDARPRQHLSDRGAPQRQPPAFFWPDVGFAPGELRPNRAAPRSRPCRPCSRARAAARPTARTR